VLRLLLTEACLLGLFGGLGALAVARLAIGGLLSLLPADDRTLLGLEMNGAMLLFTGAVSLVTSLLFGLLPAIHIVRASVAAGLGAQSGRTTGSRAAARVRTALATAQMALATALLALAGLFITSLVNVVRTDLGIQRAGLSTFRVAPVLNGYALDQSRAFFDRLEAALSGTPGVVSVSASTIPVLGDSSNSTNVTVEGFRAEPDTNMNASFAHVGMRYFSTLGIPLLAGREFSTADAGKAPRVAIVNEAFTRKFNLGPNAIGKRIGTTDGKPPDIEIVGVVGDATYRSAKEAPPAQFFLPYRQSGAGLLTFYVRSAPGSDPTPVMAAVPGFVRQLDANLPVENLRTMDEQFDNSTTLDRVLTTLSSSFALLALVLAGVGLYAVLAYAVSQRISEIGIRMALGARALDVRWMVFSQVGRITLVGGLTGGAMAVGLSQLGRALLFGVAGPDARIAAGAAVVVVAVACLAGLAPARRAAAVDPVQALRAE